MRRRGTLLAASLLAAAIFPYLGALRNGFVFDDRGVIVENPAVTRFDLGAIWSAPYWPHSAHTGLYRPLTTMTYAIDWAIGGGRPAWFIAVNILLHAAATLAAFALLRRLFPGRLRIASFAALLFAVHPIHVEAVAGIVGRAETLAALCALLAYRVWLDAEERRGGIGFILAPVLWVLSLLSKEGAAALPALLLAHRLGWLAPRAPERRLRLRDAAWPAGLAVALLLRAHALGGLAAPRVPWIDNPLAHVSPIARAAGAGGILARQLVQIVSLRGFSPDYSFAQVMPGGALYAAGAAMLAVLALAIAATIRWGRSSPAGWGVAFFLVLWLVTGNLIVPIGTAQADRLFYLPLLGILAAAIGLAARLRPQRLLTALLLLAIIGCGFSSARRARDWKDDATVFSAAVRSAPRSLKARSNLAAVILKEQSPRAAREALDLIRPVDGYAAPPGPYGPLVQREAKARMYLGERERARDLFRASLAAGADSAEVLIELGNLALEDGNGDEALAAFDAAARTGRLARNAQVGRASALAISGRFGEAADAWLPLVGILPDSVPVRAACAWNLTRAGRAAEAVRLLAGRASAGDADPRLLRELARADLAGAGSPAQALEAAERAAQRDSSDGTLAVLALAQIAAGLREEARATRARIHDAEDLEEIDAALAHARATPLIER